MRDDYSMPVASRKVFICCTLFSWFTIAFSEIGERIEFLQTLVDEAVDWAKPTLDFNEHSDSDTEHDLDCESRPHSSETNPISPVASIEVSVSTSVAVTPVPEPTPANNDSNNTGTANNVNDTNESNAGPSTPRPRLTLLRRPSDAAPLPLLTLPEAEEKELRRVAKLLLTIDPERLAEEITRGDLEVFLTIKVSALSPSTGVLVN